MNSIPGPWRITFDTNPDDCNLHCIMCEDHSPFSKTQKDRIAAHKPKRRMDITMVEKVLADAAALGVKEIIPSTMGEPLVYKQFDRIIDLCHTYGLKLNLTTNGTFPRKSVAEWANCIVPITTDVKISWNGASKKTQEKIMLGSNWETMLTNLKEFISVRNKHADSGGNYCKVTLQMTFLQTNVDELVDLVGLGIELGVDRIKGHHLWAHFPEIKELSMRRNPQAIAYWNKTVLQAQKLAQTHPLKNGRYIELANITLLGEHAKYDLHPGGSCPFLGKEAWVASDGRFNPCCAPDKLRRLLGDFGNLHDQSLAEIWHSDAYRHLKNNYMKHSVCQQCNMRKPNDDE